MDLIELIDTVIIKYLNENQDYSNYNTSVICLFLDNRILILQRGESAPWMPNKWSIVGGVVDSGEDYKTAVIRETNEEIGLTPEDVKFVKKIKTKDAGNIIYFTGRINSDRIVLDYENQKYKLIGENEVNDFDFVPYVKNFLQYAFKLERL